MVERAGAAVKRHLTALGFVLAAALTFALYSLKYEVQRLEARDESLTQAIAAEHEAVRVLKAEWSYLNNPKRLEELAFRHLDLAPADGRRFMSLIAVPRGVRPAEDDPTVDPSAAVPPEEPTGASTIWFVGTPEPEETP